MSWNSGTAAGRIQLESDDTQGLIEGIEVPTSNLVTGWFWGVGRREGVPAEGADKSWIERVYESGARDERGWIPGSSIRASPVWFVVPLAVSEILAC